MFIYVYTEALRAMAGGAGWLLIRRWTGAEDERKMIIGEMMDDNGKTMGNSAETVTPETD